MIKVRECLEVIILGLENELKALNKRKRDDFDHPELRKTFLYSFLELSISWVELKLTVMRAFQLKEE